MNVRIVIPWDPRLGESEVEDDLTIYPKWPEGVPLPNPGDPFHLHKDFIEAPESVLLYVEHVEWNIDNTGVYCFVHTRWPDAT